MTLHSRQTMGHFAFELNKPPINARQRRSKHICLPKPSHVMGCQLSKRARRARAYAITEADDPAVAKAPLQQAAHPTPKKAKASTDAHQGPPTSSAADHIKACPVPAAAKPKLDPKDFMCMNLSHKTEVKLPGSINGQQFIIDSCEGCDMYVMDACAMVTIDDCKDCRIFIGPTESSVFMRNCTNCKLACITRQLRTRDCHSCDILLMCRTRPIIESSSGIGIGCYCTPYAGLAQHQAVAKLSPFHNFWSDVFDFTRAAAGEEQHWRLLPASWDLKQFMGQIPTQVRQLMGHVASSSATARAVAAGEATAMAADETPAQQQQTLAGPEEADVLAVVCTAGQLCSVQQIEAGSFAFVLFPPGQHGAVQQWVAAQFPCSTASPVSAQSDATGTDGSGAAAATAASGQQQSAGERGQSSAAGAAEAGSVLLRTNEAAVPAEVLQQMAATAGWSQGQLKPLKAACGKAGQQQACCIGLEVFCSSAEQQELLCAAAGQLGALCCNTLQAAKLFRCLGTDG